MHKYTYRIYIEWGNKKGNIFLKSLRFLSFFSIDIEFKFNFSKGIQENSNIRMISKQSLFSFIFFIIVEINEKMNLFVQIEFLK